MGTDRLLLGHSRGYQGTHLVYQSYLSFLSVDVGSHLPPATCVASHGLGEGERSLLDYYIGLRTQRLETDPTAQWCQALLVQARREAARRDDPGSTLVWEGARPGSDSSVMRLYQRVPGRVTAAAAAGGAGVVR